MIDNEFYRRHLFGDKHEEVSFNIFEVTNFYHAMRVKKYIAVVAEIMRQELWMLQDEDEVILDIDPRYSNTIFCEHGMNLYMHSIISKVGRLPLEKKYLNNFARVEELVKNVRLRDELRAFQSPVRGKEIMEKFNLNPGKDVGRIKKAIEDAILDGEIDNDYNQAWEFMMKLDLKSI